MGLDITNKGAAGVPFYTPAQDPPSGSPAAPSSAPTAFTPLQTRGVQLHNRFVVSPMCTYSADDGHLTDFHLVHLGQFALRGAGLVFVEATAVQPHGRISPQDSGLWADSQVAPLRRVADFLHSQGVRVGIQLAHSGRKASTLAPWIGGSVKKTLAGDEAGGWLQDVVGPSPVSWDAEHANPKEMTVEDINDLVKSFADAAARSVKAGVDVIEIHGAHGYLITSFLSPISNQRTDQYGGSFENRTRLVKEVVAAVRAVIPSDMPLWLRLSGTEWMEWADGPSWTVEETIRLAKELPALGVDVLDASSGGNSAGQRFTGPRKTMHADFTRDIYAALRAAGSPLVLGTVGGYTTADEVRSVLGDKEGERPAGDLVLAARQFLREPEWVLRVAHEMGVEVVWPHQYHRAPNKLTSKF